ncbi:sigma non-opioid intracellular receptor 1-like [Liolophura sinensis]|uniref:sigma non-opioid intracellular receptor 1-like n=1 Tax=Liolophura sinensis TaxID=3198878 RepID=UPI00315921A5
MLRFIAKLLIFVVICIFSIQYWLERKSYLFDEEAVASIARKHVGTTDVKASFKKIIQTFRQRYPGHILPPEHIEWVFINAGGWMGSFCLLHASLTEYVLLFGTAVPTSGHSGRYWANISDTIVTGSFMQWKEGELSNVVYKPGDTVLHVWGDVAAVSWAEGTWMVEYGRGFIPSTLGFGLSDTIFSTQDFLTMYYVLRVYIRALLQETGFLWVDFKNVIKNAL